MYKSIDNKTKKVVAVKIINLEEADDEIEDIQQEITVLAQASASDRQAFQYFHVNIAVRQPVRHQVLRLVSQGR